MTKEFLAGAVVVVWRQTPLEKQFLLLHAVEATGDEDWAWRSPSGGAEGKEDAEACAARELYEETGLRLDLVSVGNSGPWPAFVAKSPHDASVVLSHEHDDMRWVSADEALSLVKPEIVASTLRVAIAHCM